MRKQRRSTRSPSTVLRDPLLLLTPPSSTLSRRAASGRQDAPPSPFPAHPLSPSRLIEYSTRRFIRQTPVEYQYTAWSKQFRQFDICRHGLGAMIALSRLLAALFHEESCESEWGIHAHVAATYVASVGIQTPKTLIFAEWF